MSTPRVLRIPILELVIVALILLVIAGLALLISVALPPIHIPSSQSPIQADSLKMVNAFYSDANNHNWEQCAYYAVCMINT